MIGKTNSVIVSGGGEAPANMVTTDTEQTITGKKTIGASNSLAFKNGNNAGEYAIDTVSNQDLALTYKGTDTGTSKEVFKINSGSTMFTSLSTIAPSTAGALNLGYGSTYPLGTVSAQYLSDGSTTKSMTEVLNAQSNLYNHYIRMPNVPYSMNTVINIINRTDGQFEFSTLRDYIAALPTYCQALPVIILEEANTENTVVIGGTIRIHPNYPDNLLVTGYNCGTSQTILENVQSSQPMTDDVVQI